jgi:cytochrome c biogenesis protein CcdA
MREGSLAYWVLAVVLVTALSSVIRSGLDKHVEMSRTSRAIRVIGGAIWLAMALTGIAFHIWESRK